MVFVRLLPQAASGSGPAGGEQVLVPPVTAVVAISATQPAVDRLTPPWRHFPGFEMAQGVA